MLQTFLTAYDPSDLPGGSIDPMGFEQGYLFLADKILPGMTVVANCPRYLSLLCAGATLAGDLHGLPEMKQRAARQEAILRLERLWALANVLAFEADEARLSGLRGITYAVSRMKWLRENARTKTTSDFKLLSRQTAYGVLGIYGNVAQQAKLVYRKVLEPIPSLGEPLADAFRKETQMPASVRRAINDGREEVGLADLQNWGGRSHLWGKTGAEEKRHLGYALETNATRNQFCELLRSAKAQDGEPAVNRLRRLAREANDRPARKHLWEALEAILRYENCYQLALLVFERIIFRCRRDQGGYVPLAEFGRDDVIELARSRMPDALAHWFEHVERTTTPEFKAEWTRIESVNGFLKTLAASTGSARQLTEAVLEHHASVQGGKFDRGRRKMAWVMQSEGRLSLAPTRVGELQREATKPDDIAPHDYRLTAADNWMRGASRL